MPQHDLDIANGSGAAVRADINGALMALGTTMKGPNPPPAPQAGMLWLEDDNPSSTVWTLRQFDGVEWINIGVLDTVGNSFSPANAQAGLVNLLDNAGFFINQRGYVSGSATSAPNAYTLDRWRVVTSGQSISWTDSAGVRTVTAPPGGMEQVIEGLRIGAGDHVLSWSGTAVATVNGNPVVNGGIVSLAGGVNATVRFSNGTVANPQLQVGRIPTPFERRHPAIEMEICRRYAEVVRWGMQWTAPSASDGAGSPIFFNAKRATPTVVVVATILNTNANSYTTLNISANGAWGQVISGGSGATALVLDLLVSADL